MGRAEELRDELLAGGAAAVEALRGQSESLHLECKRELTRTEKSLERLARTASAFLNTDGGVLVWGVDAPSERGPRSGQIEGFSKLENAEALVAWLRGKTSGLVVPAPVGIEHYAVVAPGERAGFVVSYVPMSATSPHRSLHGPQTYYLRSPSSSFEMPHGVLAAMFGRRPQPSMRVLVAIARLDLQPGSSERLTLAVSMRNAGVALASAPYLTVRVEAPPGPQRGTTIQANQDAMKVMVIQRHSERRTSEFDQSFTSNESLTVAPGGSMAGAEAVVWLRLRERFPVVVSGFVGAQGCPPTPWRLRVDRDPIDAAATQAGTGAFAGDDAERWMRDVFTPDTLEGGDYRHVLVAEFERRGLD